MPSIEELFHALDKEQTNLKASTTAILDDHTREIQTLRKDVKTLTTLIYTKFEGLWLKIFGVIGGALAAAMAFNYFVE